MAKRKKGMNREEAEALYDDLRKKMGQYLGKDKAKLAQAAQIAANIKSTLAGGENPKMQGSSQKVAPRAGGVVNPMPFRSPMRQTNRGPYAALAIVIMCAACKLMLSILEMSGLVNVAPAHASYAGSSSIASMAGKTASSGQFSREEIRLLTALDARRGELEERNRRLDQRENEIEKRDTEFATKLTQLREMTERLRSDRERTEQKNTQQLAQLANVYSAMDPKEAAALIEQLDLTIALDLLQKMSEKRMGQIMALMSHDRALAVTKMLSGVR